MKRQALSIVTLLVAAGFSGSALAACADELAQMMPGTTTGSIAGTAKPNEPQRVAKDGQTAPLQNTGPGQAQSTAQGGQTTGQGGIAKDGSTQPLATGPGGRDQQIATSGQDAQAQQRAGGSAATGGTTGSGSHSPAQMAALNRARTLQQQGDEAGCMAALQEARRAQ